MGYAVVVRYQSEFEVLSDGALFNSTRAPRSARGQIFTFSSTPALLGAAVRSTSANRQAAFLRSNLKMRSGKMVVH
jgi:hypothetical protein